MPSKEKHPCGQKQKLPGQGWRIWGVGFQDWASRGLVAKGCSDHIYECKVHFAIYPSSHCDPGMSRLHIRGHD